MEAFKAGSSPLSPGAGSEHPAIAKIPANKPRPRAAKVGILATPTLVISPNLLRLGARHAGRAPDRDGESIAVGADDLAAVAGAEGPPGHPGDAVLDEPDAAVGHQDVRPARVVARHGIAERAVDPAAGAVEPAAPAGEDRVAVRSLDE